MIASWNDFFNLVCETRRYQKEYFRTKSVFALDMSKRKERELDACIEQREQKRANKQPKLPIEEETNGKN
jgi:hypothetical protein